MSNYSLRRIRSLMTQFDLLDRFINRIEALPSPSPELQQAIAELKAMRADVKDGAIFYLEAPYKEEPS